VLEHSELLPPLSPAQRALHQAKTMRQVLAAVLLLLLLRSGESYRLQESPTGPTGLSCQQL